MLLRWYDIVFHAAILIFAFSFQETLCSLGFTSLKLRCVCQMIHYWDFKNELLWYSHLISILYHVKFDKDFLHKICLKVCKCYSSLQILVGRPVSELKLMCFFLPGNYLKFYNAIRSAYPDIKIISNCDGSSRSLDHPADYYDYHVNILSW